MLVENFRPGTLDAWGFGWDEGLTVRRVLVDVWELSVAAGPDDNLLKIEERAWDPYTPSVWDGVLEVPLDTREEHGWVRAQVGRRVAARGPLALTAFTGLTYNWIDGQERALVLDDLVGDYDSYERDRFTERWILAALRNRQFFSLDELNTAIAALLDRLNRRPFRKLPGSRHSAFEALDRPALRPLPEQPYVYAEWKKARVHIDYHVEVDGHYYSVPYQLVKKQLEVRLTARTVECFHANQRVASHLRSPHKGRHSTQIEHMPKSHREHAEGGQIERRIRALEAQPKRRADRDALHRGRADEARRTVEDEHP